MPEWKQGQYPGLKQSLYVPEGSNRRFLWLSIRQPRCLSELSLSYAITSLGGTKPKTQSLVHLEVELYLLDRILILWNLESGDK